MTGAEGFIFGFVGGLLPEFYTLYKMREDFHSKKPTWVKSWFYWIISICMMLLGGGAVLLYQSSGINVTIILALHIGAATPTLLTAFLAEKVQSVG